MKNKKNVIIAVMIAVALLMATGYAYFATQLNINATGNITSQWNVYFESIKRGTSVGMVTNTTTPSVSGTSAIMGVNLLYPGDYMEYNIVLKNGGTVGAIIEDIDAVATGSSAIIFSISGINIGDKLAAGASKTITVKIEYDSSVTSQPSETSKQLIVTIDAVQDIGQSITIQTPSIEFPDSLVTAIMKNNTAQSDTGLNFNSTSDSSGDIGLYYTSTNTIDNKKIYYFRGNVKNNYVKLGTHTINTCKYNGEDVKFMNSSYTISNPEDRHECSDEDYICIDSIYGNVVGWMNLTENYCTNTLKGTWTAGTPTYQSNVKNDILWRIVRINEDGSVRLITDQPVGKSAFNSNDDDNTYVGYMSGKVDAISYEEAHSNINNSTIKTFVDAWYEEKLIHYTSMMSTEAGFCNDRAISYGMGYGKENTGYGASGRNSRYFIPTFNCSQTNDLFTYNSTKGNNKLDYPVGLLTMDEAIYAGNHIDSKEGVYETAGYLQTGGAWWTMTPNNFTSSDLNYYYMKSPGGSVLDMYINNVTSVLGVRPVINLKGSVEITGGNGTISSPYIIKTN